MKPSEKSLEKAKEIFKKFELNSGEHLPHLSIDERQELLETFALALDFAHAEAVREIKEAFIRHNAEDVCDEAFYCHGCEKRAEEFIEALSKSGEGA